MSCGWGGGEWGAEDKRCGPVPIHHTTSPPHIWLAPLAALGLLLENPVETSPPIQDVQARTTVTMYENLQRDTNFLCSCPSVLPLPP